MQPEMGAFPDEEWGFSRIFCTEDYEFTPDILSSFPLESHEGSEFAMPSAFSSEEDFIMGGGAEESLFYVISQENTRISNGTCLFSDSNNIPATKDDAMSMDEKNGGYFSTPIFPEIALTGTDCTNEDMNSNRIIRNLLDYSQTATINAASAKNLDLKRRFDAPELNGHPSDITEKKPRVIKDQAQKSTKKNAGYSKRNQKLTPSSNDEEESNTGRDGQSSRSYSTSDDDNVSQDSNNGGPTSDSKVSETLNHCNGKTRAPRGSATDPQSIYARKRRDRINQRLRILQNLVPNGTKVDISTMLEEAVHYVKFLQLQIKLLSSDDLWMYAPIAHNGIDISLSQKISTLS